MLFFTKNCACCGESENKNGRQILDFDYFDSSATKLSWCEMRWDELSWALHLSKSQNINQSHICMLKLMLAMLALPCQSVTNRIEVSLTDIINLLSRQARVPICLPNEASCLSACLPACDTDWKEANTRGWLVESQQLGSLFQLPSPTPSLHLRPVLHEQVCRP